MPFMVQLSWQSYQESWCQGAVRAGCTLGQGELWWAVPEASSQGPHWAWPIPTESDPRIPQRARQAQHSGWFWPRIEIAGQGHGGEVTGSETGSGSGPAIARRVCGDKARQAWGQADKPAYRLRSTKHSQRLVLLQRRSDRAWQLWAELKCKYLLPQPPGQGLWVEPQVRLLWIMKAC